MEFLDEIVHVLVYLIETNIVKKNKKPSSETNEGFEN